MADDKIIQFPKNRIVNDRTRELDAQRKKMGEKVAKQIQQQQTKQFVETAVDDISMNVKSNFTVAISTEPQIMENAAEHLLHLAPNQIESLVSEIILGQLCVIFASITFDQINSRSEELDELIFQKIGKELGNVGIYQRNAYA